MPWPWKIALALVWGLVLGIFAAAWTAATLLAAGWIYLYGDDAWPAEFTERTVPLVSGLAGLFAFAAVAGLWASMGRISPGLVSILRARAALRWTLLAIPILLVAAAMGAVLVRQIEADRAHASEQALASRAAEAHRLTGAAWRLTRAEGMLHLGLVAIGATPAEYDLSWEARGPGFAEPFGSGATTRQLPAGPTILELDLDARALAGSYAEQALTRAETVEIDLPLAVHLTLTRRGERGSESHLIVKVPLSYRYEPGGLVTFAMEMAGRVP